MQQSLLTPKALLARNPSRGGSGPLSRRRSSLLAPALVPALLALPGCGEDPVPPPTQNLAELTVPAEEGSEIPNLLASNDGFFLSWFQEDGDGHALQFDRLGVAADGASPENSDWHGVRTIAEGDDFFVNWADVPSMARFPDGSLAAHWLVRSGPGPVDYDIHLARSEDEGETWSDAVVPHRDGFQTEHGFVSLFHWEDEALGLAWLDGREIAQAAEAEASGEDPTSSPAMTLRFTTFDEGGELGSDDLLDGQVCDCCPTSAAVTDQGPVVVYRDRTGDEIRDISIIRHLADGWSEPMTVHDDGWEISACPVNGPMVSAQGDRLAVAWYTGADDDPRVLVAFSQDAGESFTEPVRVDGGNPLGRAATDLLPSGDALVAWLEEEDEDAALQVRRISPDGGMSSPETVGRSAASRAAGFPRMARHEDLLLFAWTDARGEAPEVRAATARVPSP